MGGAIINLYQIPEFFNTFLETGTNLGHTTAFVAEHFKKIYTIELSSELYKATKKRLSHLNNVTFIHGDSSATLKKLCPKLQEAAVFYLDAHWAGGVTAHGKEEVPVYKELESIARRPVCDLIIIDDYRLFGRKGVSGTPGDTQYPEMEFDWRDITVERCLEFFPESKFYREFVIRDDRVFLLKRPVGDTNTSLTLATLGLSPQPQTEESPGSTVEKANSDRLTWNPKLVNTYDGPALAIQTTYEQRYLRGAIRQVLPRLPKRTKAAEFGAGYSRLTPVLEEFFEEAIGLEREAGLIALSGRPVTSVRMHNVSKLSEVPLETGAVALAYTCAVLQHMMDEDVGATLAEMRRVSRGGFIVLIELTREGYLDGTYGPATYFTKGRSIASFEEMMAPWVLDFTRPRPIGSVDGPVWGEIMVFRDPEISAVAGLRQSGSWETAELRPELRPGGS